MNINFIMIFINETYHSCEKKNIHLLYFKSIE